MHAEALRNLGNCHQVQVTRPKNPLNTSKTTATALAAAAALLLLLVVSSMNVCTGLDNGLARTPPMGWLAWERFVCETNCELYPQDCISEQLFIEMADRLVDDGFARAGYNYVNIDDCWSERKRQLAPGLADGKLAADSKRFPRGIRPLADYMHAKNLKLGLYGDCGTSTCQLFPGQLNSTESLQGNYFRLDAQTFANEWQIDSFKFDACNVNVSKAHTMCPEMGAALNETQRPVLFACSWPAYENDEQLETDFAFVADKCNLWRAFGDIEDSWKSVLETVDWFVRKQTLVVKYHRPGAWFDADQLVIGDFGLSASQERAHMAIWCMWSSPLYMSNDLRALNKESSRLLRNKWLIEVNQDKFGVFALMLASYNSLQAFIKPVEPLDASGCPSYAVAYLNRATLGTSKLVGIDIGALVEHLHSNLTEADAERFGVWSKCANSTKHASETRFSVYDLVNNNAKLDVQPSLADKLELFVEPSGVRLVKLIKQLHGSNHIFLNDQQE